MERVNKCRHTFPISKNRLHTHSAMPPPERWENYQALGRVIPGTRLIAFKVPLKKDLCEKLPEEEQFTPRSLVSMVKDLGSQLGMVIDLTFTRKYYNAYELENQGVRYEKIFTEGHNVPCDDVVYRFFDTLESFYEASQDDNQVVGVHCTHGINRTGYVVCRYMIERLGFEPEKAMTVYHESRGYPIERENYIADLRTRQLNNDYKYEGREKLPMKKVEQNNRQHRSHTNRRRSQEKDLHRNGGYEGQNDGMSPRKYESQQRGSRHYHQSGYSHHRDQRHQGHHQGDQHNWDRGSHWHQEGNWRYDGYRHREDRNRYHEDREYNGGRNSYYRNNGHHPPHYDHFRQGYRDGYNDERYNYYPRRGRNHRHFEGGGSDRNPRGGRHQYQSWDDRSHHWRSENYSQKRNRHDSGELNKTGSQNYKRQNSLSNKNSPDQRHKESLSKPCSSTQESEKTSKSTCAEEREGKPVSASSSRSNSAKETNRESPSDIVTDNELMRIAETELVISQEHQPPVASQTSIDSEQNQEHQPPVAIDNTEAILADDVASQTSIDSKQNQEHQPPVAIDNTEAILADDVASQTSIDSKQNQEHQPPVAIDNTEAILADDVASQTSINSKQNQEHQPPVASQTSINSKQSGEECARSSCHRTERVQNSDQSMDNDVESVPL